MTKRKKRQVKRWIRGLFCLVILIATAACAALLVTQMRENKEYGKLLVAEQEKKSEGQKEKTDSAFKDLGTPQFSKGMMSKGHFIRLSPLDRLGRCGPCEMMITKDSMPTKEREPIGMVKPTGWHTVRYDDLIEDKYLYNRGHLLGYQISGLNADKENLITMTRQCNAADDPQKGMLPWENKVAWYVRRTGNPVAYRVTPVFRGKELVARGVKLEAKSVRDDGISFAVYIPNRQDGIVIDYLTGVSRRK